MAPVALFVISVLSHLLLIHYVAGTKNCPSYYCNEIVGYIHFPFKNSSHPAECGLYTVDCSIPSSPKIQLTEGGYWHNFDSISSTNSVHINDQELQESLPLGSCSDEVLYEMSLPSPSPIFDLLFTNNLTLFKCNTSLTPPPADLTFGCINSTYTYYTLYNKSTLSPPPPCLLSQIPILPNRSNLDGLTTEFSLQVQVTEECYQCYEQRKGACLVVDGKFQCSKGETNLSLKLGLGLSGGVVGLVVLVLVILCSLWRKLSFIFFWKKQNQSYKNLEAFLPNFGPFQVERYSYVDVKKMTNSFEEKLGQGGYGGVYKGKLKSGPLVAVKVLNISKGNGEDFMNEVAAISRTSHVNIVSLLGFCFEGSKRALVYEFMPNGSLEKFIFNASKSQEDHHHLGWEVLLQISLGIARGLEYLHHGCKTRILHFDIKPHNILLDENFLPKISDFGLAKLCDRKESIVSMLYARGTVGYIAPEVFCRSFGGVSHKSDVYSYGIMLSEMAGGRRNINVEVENTSEIYFPHWIYNRLELDEELGLQSIKSEEDKARARKVIIVSLWCIQTDPSNRPAMKEVIEMLEGSVESLKIPPKPYLSFPPRSPAIADSSSTLISRYLLFSNSHGSIIFHTNKPLTAKRKRNLFQPCIPRLLSYLLFYRSRSFPGPLEIHHHDYYTSPPTYPSIPHRRRRRRLLLLLPIRMIRSRST